MQCKLNLFAPTTSMPTAYQRLCILRHLYASQWFLLEDAIRDEMLPNLINKSAYTNACHKTPVKCWQFQRYQRRLHSPNHLSSRSPVCQRTACMFKLRYSRQIYGLLTLHIVPVETSWLCEIEKKNCPLSDMIENVAQPFTTKTRGYRQGPGQALQDCLQCF